MNRSTLLSATLAAVVALAAIPQPAAGAIVNRASMALTTSYVLKAKLSYAAATISTAETISIKNISGAAISKVNLSVMPRAFGELTSIGTFRVDGVAVSARWTNTSNLEINFGKNVAHLASTTVSLTFAVKASSRITTSLEGRLSKANSIMQVSHWFPIISDGHDARYPGDSQFTRTAAKIRLELTTESTSIKVAAPGVRVVASGVNHVYEIANARDFAFGVSPVYKSVSGSAGGVGVVAYYATGAGSTALSYAMAALTRFESMFGQYQWTRFVVAQTGRPSSGNEYPGIVFLGGPVFTSREVIAHETAHQWWYGMAGNDQMREPWLDEGIAEFAASYAFGSLNSWRSTRPVNSTIYEFPNVPAPQTSGDANSYDQTIYFKASGFLNGLRTRMGNARFFDALADLFAANRNGIVTSVEFYDTFARYGASTTYMRSFIRL